MAPAITLTIDGTSVNFSTFAPVSESLSDVAIGVQTVIFKLDDNGLVSGDAAYYVNEFNLFADLAGTTILF